MKKSFSAKELANIRHGRHYCFFYDKFSEFNEILISYLMEGLRAGEKVLYAYHSGKPEDIARFILNKKMDPGPFLHSGQLEFIPACKIYFPCPGFNPDRIIDSLNSACENILKSYPGMRFTSEMEFLPESCSGRWEDIKNAFYDYECRLNSLFQDLPVSSICQYNIKSFDPEMLQEILYAHPFVIGRSGIYKNYFHVSAEDFLNRKNLVSFHNQLHALENYKKTEDLLDELEKTEKRYKTMIETITDYFYSVYMKNKKPFRTVHGQGCIAVTGYSPADFDNNPYLWIDIVFEDDRASVKKHAEKIISEHIPDQLEHRIIKKNGELRWVRNTPVYHYDSDGRLLSYDGLIQDITDYKKVGEELRQSESRFKQFFEYAPMYCYMLSPGRTIINVNKYALQTLGYDPEELSGAPISRIFSEDSGGGPMFKESVSGDELEIKTKSGEKRIVISNYAPIRARDGSIISYICIQNDITKSREAEKKEKLHQQQLIQASKMVALGTLVAGVAHEINNPNNFITLNTPLLEDIWKSVRPVLEEKYEKTGDFPAGGLNYSEMRDHIPRLFSGIMDGASRIKRIVEDLKNFARHDMTSSMELVDINAVIRAAVTLLENLIKKSTKNFRAEYGKNIPLFRGNFQRMEQVIINLVQNACQAMRDPLKAIFVSTNHNAGSNRICVIVRDEGVGIPGKNLDRIFDPFFTTKREFGGTGLGLAVSLGIIKDHGGRINFYSSPGQGTEVLIEIPVG